MPHNLAFSAIYLLVATVLFSLALLCLVHYRTAVAKALALLLVASGIYAFAYAFEIMYWSPAWTWLWLRIEYIGIAPISSGFVWLALTYTDSHLLKRKWIRYLLIGVPTVLILLVHTNQLHHLFYSQLTNVNHGTMTTVLIGRGPAYFAYSAWQMATFVTGLAIYNRYYRHAPAVPRNQAFYMLIAPTFPITYFVAYQAKLITLPLDGNPLAIGLASCLFAWAILREGLLDISPIARERIFTSMQDGIIVTDQWGNIVDFNPAAATFLALNRQILGQPIFSILPQLARFSGADHRQRDKSPLLVPESGKTNAYDIWQIEVLSDKRHPIGTAWHVRQITEEYNLLQQLQLHATRDALTGIYNRRRWAELSEELLGNAESRGDPLAMLLIDIDHFKQVNDHFGHAVGDLLLTEIAQIISAGVSPEHVVGRLGGEEFAVTLAGVPVAAARALAEHLRETVAQHVFRYEQLPPLTITISVGVSVRLAGTGESVQELTHRADAAMYLAKNNGRNQVRIADECSS